MPKMIEKHNQYEYYSIPGIVSTLIHGYLKEKWRKTWRRRSGKRGAWSKKAFIYNAIHKTNLRMSQGNERHRTMKVAE